MKHLSIWLKIMWSLFIGMMQLAPWRSEELLAWNPRTPGSLSLGWFIAESGQEHGDGG